MEREKNWQIFLSISSYFVIFDAGGVSLRSGTAASLRDRRDSWRLIFAKYFSLFVNIFFCFFIFGQICCTGRPGETGETFGGKYLQIFLFIVCQHFFPYSHIWSYLLLRPGSFCERQEGRLDASEWKLRPLSFATFSICFYKSDKKLGEGLNHNQSVSSLFSCPRYVIVSVVCESSVQWGNAFASVSDTE